MNNQVSVAIAGAATPVGEALLDLLSAQGLPITQVFALGDESTAGDTVGFGNRALVIRDQAGFDFRQVGLVWLAAYAEAAERALQAGCRVVDLTGRCGAPLVLPELNAAAARGARIVAAPSATAVQLALVLQPLLAVAGIARLQLATYEAVSDRGRAAVEELGRQTADLLSFRSIEPRAFGRQIAFNVLPQIGALLPDGRSQAEARLEEELRTLLATPELAVSVTAVQVPVFYGHSVAVNLQTRQPLTPAEAAGQLAARAGIEVIDAGGDGPTPVTDASGTAGVYVGRIRRDLSQPLGLNLWVVSDNIRRGAAATALALGQLLMEGAG